MKDAVPINRQAEPPVTGSMHSKPTARRANPFAPEMAADLYARGRPYYHPIVIDRIRQALTLQEPVSRALDVGCGTGQSTRALLTLAREVVGIDASPAMLRHAPAHPRLTFMVASAEKLPLPDRSFDLITVAATLHWLDRQRFFEEAARVLSGNAWMVIYDNTFLGEMDGQPDFAAWMRDVYLARYPSPPRNRSPLTAAEVSKLDFHLTRKESYTNAVRFSPEELIAYLITQSNIIAAVEDDRETFESAKDWLGSELSPLFHRSRPSFSFGGTITYLQRC